MAFNTLNQRAAFDHLLKARILYDPNSRYVLDAQTNALNSGLTNVTINNLLPQRLQQIDTQLASHKTLPTVTWDNIPGPLPPPNQRDLAINNDSDNMRNACIDGRLLLKKASIDDFQQGRTNNIKVFPSFPHENNLLCSARNVLARNSSCPYDNIQLTSSLFDGSRKTSEQAMQSHGSAWHVNQPSSNITYGNAAPRLSLSSIGIQSALHGDPAQGGQLHPNSNFLTRHLDPNWNASVANLWQGNTLRPPTAGVERTNGAYLHSLGNMEVVQGVGAIQTRISNRRWRELMGHGQNECSFPDGGHGYISSANGLYTILPGNFLSSRHMSSQCQHYNRQAKRLYDVNRKNLAWLQSNRYDTIRSNHLTINPVNGSVNEDYNGRRDDLVQNMTHATTYLSSGANPPNPDNDEEGKLSICSISLISIQ